MRRAIKWSGIILISLLICQISYAKTKDDTLVVATQIDDLISLDPAEVFEFSGIEISTNVYDRLMMYDAENTTILLGGVAESWHVSSNGKAITFNIKKGLSFHSSNPITADDVAFSLRRVIKLDKTPAFILKQFGWTKENVDKLIYATKPYELIIEIEKKFSPLLVFNCLASVVGSVVDKKEVLAHEKNGDLGNAWLKRRSAGSGPFKIKTWKPNNMVVLEKNPTYRKGSPQINRLVMKHINDTNTQRILLEKGDVDIVRMLNVDQLKEIEKNEDIRIRNFPQAVIHFIGLNQKVEKLKHPKVWEAMRWLVDYDGMAETFLKGRFKVHQSFWPTGFRGSLEDRPFRLDIEKAKKLLAEAGLEKGFSIDLDIMNTPVNRDIAQSIQQTFSKVGIKVNIVAGVGAQVLTKYRNRQHELILIQWGPDFLDAHSNASSFAFNADNSNKAKISSSAWRNAWEIPELSQMTLKAAREYNPSNREKLYLKIQREVQLSSPYVILFQETTQVAMRKNIKGYISGLTNDTIYYYGIKKQPLK